MKTLQQAEPRTPISTNAIIRVPGSYYLTTNLLCYGTTGIMIYTNDVTLDLNGFSLIGNGIGSGYGISASAGRKFNFVLRNGSVVGFSGSGMDVSVIHGCLIENVMFMRNGWTGMAVGDHSQIINCRAYQNGGAGIYADDRCVVSGCISWENERDGILGGYECVVTDCTSYSNLNDGISFSGGLIQQCAVSYNASNGIYAGLGARVTDNTCLRNGVNGIWVSSRAVVRGNNCIYNGQLSADGAGIYASTIYNRIEENHVESNDIGLRCPSSPNFIAKNSAVANTTEYDVSAGNRFAPLDTSGNFTNAWANFEF